MTCTAHIGRKQAIWIGKESTAGTKVSASDWIAKTSWVMTPVIATTQDTAGYWVIDEVYDVQPVKEHTELSLDGTVDNNVFNLLLLWVFWAVATTWSWPYTHTYTRANSNCHQSFTIWGSDPVSSHSASYAMVDAFELKVELENFATFSCNMLAKKMVDEVEPTVTYWSDKLFRARDCKVYFADTEAGLSSANEVKLTKIRLSINKNLMLHQALGDDDIEKIFNQQFNVTGDFEAVYATEDHLDLVRSGDKKYMKIELINTSIDLTGWGNPTITFTLSKVALESRSQTGNNNDIVKQTIWFVWTYNASDDYTIKATTITDRATV